QRLVSVLAHQACTTFVQVDQGVERPGYRQGYPRAGFQMDVGIEGLSAAAGDRTGDRTATDLQFTGNHPDGYTLLARHRNLLWLNVPVTGGLHFFGGRQVEPELETPHNAGFLLRHFRMHDAPARGHPLHPAVAEVAAIPQV